MGASKVPAYRVGVDPATWAQVGDQEVYTNDIVHEGNHPEAQMTVGFVRMRAGDAIDGAFPYDEVLIVTKGVLTVHNEAGERMTFRPGEVVYMPAESTSTFRADEEIELVYVAHPPAVYASWVREAAGG